MLVDILGQGPSYFKLSLIAGLVSMRFFFFVLIVISNFIFCSAKINMSFLPLNHVSEVRLDTRICFGRNGGNIGPCLLKKGLFEEKYNQVLHCPVVNLFPSFTR